MILFPSDFNQFSISSMGRGLYEQRRTREGTQIAVRYAERRPDRAGNGCEMTTSKQSAGNP